jgi:GntP family gluconate:H+ symporter
MSPLLVLLLGMTVVVGAIVLLRQNAFLALVAGAILVSLLAPGESATRIVRVAEAFGRTAGSIGIVIAFAAIIGKAMAESGAADRIVAAFLSALGEERVALALVGSGFVLAIPVFFDTVFYLLVPLARSLHGRTGRHYLRYLMAICAGAAATHALVPPTPGPLAVAALLHVDLGVMLLVGAGVAVPAALLGLLFSTWVDTRMPVVPRFQEPNAPSAAPALPGLGLALAPILLPVALIATKTVTGTLAEPPSGWSAVSVIAVLGDPNLALLLSATIAVAVYRRQRNAPREDVAALVESALMSGGVIILITAAGGAFGAMLQAAGVGPAIQDLFGGGTRGPGLTFLFLAFGVSSLVKVAQGSSTVAMITAAGMVGAMVDGTVPLPYHPVYLATAIASGSLVGSWMNDSGFWVFTKMGGLTEAESLRSWTALLAVLGCAGMAITLMLALALPLR